MTIAPKYTTHYYHSAKTIANSKVSQAPNVINLFFDFNCAFSGKLFLKLHSGVIPKLQERHPGRFQFVYVNVIQPWHPNSVFLNEFGVVAARLIRDKVPDQASEQYWNFAKVLYENKDYFKDSYNVDLNRNQIYEEIYDVVSKEFKLPFSKDEILSQLQIAPKKVDGTHVGNGATVDIKYFTKYLRGVGVHVTPTVSVNGIVDDSISSGSEIEALIEKFEAHL